MYPALIMKKMLQFARDSMWCMENTEQSSKL